MFDAYDVAEFDMIGGKRNTTTAAFVWTAGKGALPNDYRILVERGAIPRETVLIGGIAFWKKTDDH